MGLINAFVGEEVVGQKGMLELGVTCCSVTYRQHGAVDVRTPKTRPLQLRCVTCCAVGSGQIKGDSVLSQTGTA